MGIGGAGDGTLGLVAVTKWLTSLLLLVGMLAGCKSGPQIAAVIAGGVSGTATGNPAVGFAVGVATDAGANYAFRSIARTWQGAEQDAIARIAGDLPIGGEATWQIEHSIPIGNEHGQLRVVRVIESPLAICKRLTFSVDEGKGEKLTQGWFATDICKQAETWKWASAEPAVERWGYLQSR
jgi:hypothetical protein